MDYTFPEKYEKVVEYFDFVIGDVIESTRLTDDQKLMFYALRQQSEHGPCEAPAPSLWNYTERVKHQAWSRLGSMSRYEAMVLFVRQFEEYLGTPNVCWRGKIEAEMPPPPLTPAAGEWDSDILQHQEPTEANIRYLSEALMAARHAAQLAPVPAAEEGKRTDEQPPGTVLCGPPSRPAASVGSVLEEPPVRRPQPPPTLASGPPVKPLFDKMTQAAIRSSDGAQEDVLGAWSWKTLL